MRCGRHHDELLSQPAKIIHQAHHVAPGTDATALEHQRSYRDLPALILFANQILPGYFDVLEENLIEAAIPSNLNERTDGNSRTVHIHKDITDAFMLGCLSIRSHQQDAPVGMMGTGGPYFLSINYKVIAILHRSRLQ